MRESQVRNMPDMPTQMWAVYEEMKQRRERGGWRAVGRLMKVSGAYARQLARGEKPITPTLARAWLEGTQQITQTAIAPVCPDCGNVHTGRCHGKPVAAVVCLAPDETVRPVAKAQRPRRTPYGALSLRRTTLDRLAQHRTGRTADALINALLDKWEQEPSP